MNLVVVDTRLITDWDSFHEVFARAFGFPAYYGRNMDAWIDCMTTLNDPLGSDTTLFVSPGEIVVLQLEHAGDFERRCPEIYSALIESSAFVNHRLVEQGHPPALALAWRE